MQIPDYLIYDEIKRRREREDRGLDRLELPLYRPNDHEERRDESEDERDSNRGVVIIDLYSDLEMTA